MDDSSKEVSAYGRSDGIEAAAEEEEAYEWKQLKTKSRASGKVYTVYFCFTLDKHGLITGGRLSEIQHDMTCHIFYDLALTSGWP